MPPLSAPSGASSSTTLWATASKEWVIQPKPKPGRKPKKDLPAPSNDDAETDSKGRRVQNRAAQRAFRERKQSQLSELQARIQAYEQGEIERNVALQNIAKRLKEENDILRKDNFALQTKLTLLEQKQQGPQVNVPQITDKKRWRDETPSSVSSSEPPAKKKSRKGSVYATAASETHLPSPASMVSTPDPMDTSDHYSPLHFDSQTDMDSGFNMAELSSDMKEDDPLTHFSSFGCGFCDQDSICVCRAMAAHSAIDTTLSSAEFKTNNPSASTSRTIKQATNQPPVSDAGECPSILDNLPAYQPPVPLKRRANGVSVNSIFPVRAALRRADRAPEATCSGDPSNCLACAGDDFGKAFCAAIGSSSSGACDCASHASTSTSGGCCGGTSNCAQCPSISPSSNNPIVAPTPEDSDMIPTNDAWQKLKEHPNVAFTDLSLLAEVVASRSKCTGPRLVISPAPQTASHDTGTSNPPFNAARGPESIRRVGNSPPPMLVPQEVLLECGRRRMRQVHAAGVQEALRMLDAKFTS